MIDDGSVQKESDTIKNYINNLKDNRIKFESNYQNIQVPKTLNKGIKEFLKHDSTYLTWISDDNEYYPNFLSTLYNLQGDFSHTAWNSTRRANVDIHYKKIEDLLYNWQGLASFMWSKNAIKKIGFYNEDLHGVEDYEYILRTYIYISNIKYSNSFCMNYYTTHQDRVSKTHKNNNKKLRKIVNDFYKNIVQNISFFNFNQNVQLIYYTDSKYNDIDSEIKEKYKYDIFLTNDDICNKNVFSHLYKNLCYYLFNNKRLKLIYSDKNIQSKDNFDNSLFTLQKILCINKTEMSNIYNKNVSISIVMCYYNQKLDLLNTFVGFEEMYTGKYNFEVIIVKDNDKLIESISKYSFSIKIITENLKDSIISTQYQRGVSETISDIIIFQSPGCYHMENIIENTINNLSEQKFLKYGNNCFAIYKSKFNLIGFDSRFQSNEFCMKAFILAAEYNLRLDIKLFDKFIKDNNFFKDQNLADKKLYENIKKIHERNDFIYPKLMFLYWDGSPMSYLNYLTIESFNEYNPEWKIVVYSPEKKIEHISWSGDEQKIKYTGKCYLSK